MKGFSVHDLKNFIFYVIFANQILNHEKFFMHTRKKVNKNYDYTRSNLTLKMLISVTPKV